MANQRVTDLDPIVTLPDSGIIHVVDTTNNAQNAAGSSFKITKANLLKENTAAILLNTAKVGISTAQATAITNNTNKVGYTEALVNANANVVVNTAKVGITTLQATAITANASSITVIQGKTSTATVLTRTSQLTTFLNKTTGLSTGSGGGVYGTNIYNILGLRGTLSATTKWTSNASASICLSLLKNGVVVYKTSQTIDLVPTDTVELTSALDADTLQISVQIDQNAFTSANLLVNRFTAVDASILAANVKTQKPSSILLNQDFSKSTANLLGNFTQSATGITINTVGDFITVNRFYSIDQRLIRCVFTAQSGVIDFGRQEIEGAGTNVFFLSLNIPSNTITLGATTVSHTFVVGRKYILDLKLQNKDVTATVQDFLTGAKVVVTSADLTTFYDRFAIKRTSGTSQILNSVSVFFTKEPPFLYIVGDSITYGSGVTNSFVNRYATLIGEKTGKSYVVSGRAGGTINSFLADTTLSYVSKMFSEIQFLRPKYVMISIGTNGLNTVANLSAVVEQIQAYGSIVILNNVPCRATGTTSSRVNEDVSIKNNIIKTVRDIYNLKGCSFELATSVNNDGITTDINLYTQEAYTPDFIWIHPNVAGQQKMFERSLIDVPDLYIDAGVTI